MHKSKLIFRFILSAAIATSVQLTLRSNYAVAQDASFNPTVEYEQQNDTSEDVNFAITGIGIGVIAGLLFFGFYQKHRQCRLYSTAKIDRFREEFLCGSLADYYLSNSQANASPTNSRQSLATPSQEKIPTSPTFEESLVKPNLIAKVTPDAVSNSLSDSYQKLIAEIVTTILKDEICSQEYIYHQLVENVSNGNGETFERCLSDCLNSTQSELKKVTIYPDLFQRETPELKKARLNLTLKALQSIQSEWERVQKKRNQAAVTAAVQQILTASKTSRFSVLLQIIDPNQNQIFSQSQLQQLAQKLKQAVSADENLHLKEIQQLAIALANSVESYQQLEGSVVSWIYDPTANPLELTLLTSFQLNPAQGQLISGINTYLELSSQQEVVFQEQLATIEPKQQEKVIQIVNSWMQQAQKQGELKLLMRLLNRRLGEISPQIKSRIANLSTPDLENLAEALLYFSCVGDLEAWFENIS
ncbi:MAG: DUF4351 domain-containing protein [Nostoc sp.]